MLLKSVWLMPNAQEIGVTRSDIARSLAMNYSGVTAGLYREKDELLPIVIRAPEKERQRIDDMNNVQIWSETKQCFVPIEPKWLIDWMRAGKMRPSTD